MFDGNYERRYKQLKSESEKLYRLLIDSIWACPKPFTKEQLEIELDKNGVILKDFDGIKELCKDYLVENNGLYSVDITSVYNKIYGK